MAEDLIPDWRVQVSLKFGPALSSLVNVRADDFPELAELLDNLPATLGDKIANAELILGKIATVAQGTGGHVTTVSSEPTTTYTADLASAKQPPSCAHGVRVFRSGASKRGPWQAFFCCTDKDFPNKCDAIFKDQDNAKEPYWP